MSELNLLSALSEKLKFFSGSNSVFGFIIVGVLNAFLMITISQKFVVKIQELGNSGYSYRQWLKKIGNVFIIRLIMLSLLSLAGFLLLTIVLSVFNGVWVAYVGFVMYLIFIIIYLRKDRDTTSGIDSTMSTRSLRLIVTFSYLVIILSVLASFLFDFLIYVIQYDFGNNALLSNVRYCLFCLCPIAVPYIVLLAHYINVPYERHVQKKRLAALENKLKQYSNLKKIIVVGDRGKTTLKNILSSFLSVKYKVLTSKNYGCTIEEFFNITSTLDETYDYLIFELSDKDEEVVKKIIQTVKADIVVFNEIGPNTVMNMGVGKVFPIELMCENNLQSAYFTLGSEDELKIFHKTSVKKYLLNEDDNVFTKDICVNKEGTTFILSILGDEYKLSTNLLGKRCVQNISYAAFISINEGIGKQDIVNVIPNLVKIPHQLEIINNKNDILSIDDTYNRDYIQITNSIEVVDNIKVDGKKIIVTPGIAEFLSFDKDYNYQFGIDISQKFDEIILVGRVGSLKVRDSLLSNDYPIEKIHMVKTIEEGKKVVSSIAKSGDLILYEGEI